MRVVPVVGLALLAVTSGAASANQFHAQLARMPDAERNEVFTEQMRKTAEPPCKVTRSYFQGFTDARAAVWSVGCTSQRSYAIMVGDDSKGSTKFVDCEKLRAATQGQARMLQEVLREGSA